MGNWFSRLFGSASASEPTPQGFKRISELPRSTPKVDYSFLILDWRLAPNPPHEYGSIFVWLEVNGKRQGYFVGKKEAFHFDTVLTTNVTHLRVVLNRGCWYVLPVNPCKENPVTTLPPPPKVFPPVGTAMEQPPSSGGKSRS